MQYTLRHTLSPLVLALGLAAPLLSQPLHAQGLRLSDTPSSAARSDSGQPRETDLAQAARNAAAASQRNTQQADFIVALVNSDPITHHEVQTRKQRALAFLQAQGYNAPDDSVLQREAIDTLIAERLQLQEARDTGTTVDDFTLDQAEQNVAQQNGASIANMYKELAAEGIDRDSFRTQLRNQLILMRIRERAVDARVRITDQELDQHLRDNPLPGGNVADRLNLGHILVTVPENATATEETHLREKVTEAAQRLEQGEDFAAVSAQYSEAAEASQGGVLGMRAIDQYPELFVQSVAGREVGALVGPIRSGAGFHLLKVLEREEGQKDVIAQNHARHILISPSSGMDERAASQRLLEIRQRVVKGGEDFAMLAREYSQDKGSAPDGGDLGWSSPGQFVPEFEEVLASLNPGEVSPPIVSRFGMHLIQLLERRHIPMTQQHRRELVRERVREQKAEKVFADWITQLRSRAYIEIRDNQS